MLTLKVTGSPKQRGESHGETFRKQIHELTQIRRDLLYKFLSGLSTLEVETLAFRHVEYLKNYAEDFEEFCGIARASNLSLTDLMILNNYTDMRDFYPGEETKTSTDSGGCSVVSIRKGQSRLCGQTWDMHASATPYILNLQIEDHTQVLTVAGCLGLAGVTSDAVGVFINNMHCRETKTGLMWPALVRGMLRKKSASEALEFLRSNIPSSGHNYLICDPTRTINVETTGTRVEISHDLNNKDGVAFHTNHYITSLKSEEILSRQSKSTFPRFEALESYFKDGAAEHDLSSFGDQLFGGGVAICIPRPPKETPHAPMTCGGITFDLQTKKGQIFQGLFAEGKHNSFYF